MTQYAHGGPLQTLSMSDFRPRRRSATRAFGELNMGPVDKENAEPSLKKLKRNADGNAQKEPAKYVEDHDGFQFKRKPRSKAKLLDSDPQVMERRSSLRSARNAPANAVESPAEAKPAQVQVTTKSSKSTRRSVKPRRESTPPPAVQTDTTMVQLPISDTPIMRKNKELRQTGAGRRRSSAGFRGRRASSLIDNGHLAIPHEEIEPTQYFKHIGAELPEPRRMKQLLTWCASRTLSEKTQHAGEEGNARAVARVIQEELLKDFQNRADLSDWFNREDGPSVAIVKKPNPKNLENLQKLQECEQRLKRLREEKETWLKTVKSQANKDKGSEGSLPKLTFESLKTTLLDPQESEFVGELLSEGPLDDSVSKRLGSISSGLEALVDNFADGLHRLSQQQMEAEAVADRLLGRAASILEMKEDAELKASRTANLPIQGVLVALSRLER